jgi:hypothetical protein
MDITTEARKQTKAGRVYLIDGQEMPSVTSILSVIGKPALIPWAAKVEREMVIEASANLYHDSYGTPKLSQAAWILSMQSRLGKMKAHTKELAKASEIGSQAHALIEWTLKAKLLQQPGPAPRVSDKAQWSFMAWEDWAKSVKLKPLYVEQVVYSRRFGYAGTLDLLAEVDGKLTVVDWKTGKAVYAEAHLQNAAYRQAIREMGHGNPVQGIIVRLPKVDTDPEFQAVVADQEKFSFDAFLHAFELWNWTQIKDAEYQKSKELVSAGNCDADGKGTGDAPGNVSPEVTTKVAQNG